MDIKVSQEPEVYQNSTILVKLEESRQSLLYQFDQEWKSSLVPTENTNVNDLKKKFENMIKEKKKYNKNEIKIARNCLKILDKLGKIQKRIKFFEKKIDERKTKKRKIESAYITFRYRKDKKLFKSFLPKYSRLRKFCFLRGKIYKREKISGIGINQLSVKEPSDPLNINWEYLHMNKFKRIFRRMLVWAFYWLFVAMGKIDYFFNFF